MYHYVCKYVKPEKQYFVHFQCPFNTSYICLSGPSILVAQWGTVERPYKFETAVTDET